MTNLRLPNITAQTADAQLRQMKSYLYQLVQELNYTLDQLENEIQTLKDTAQEEGK